MTMVSRPPVWKETVQTIYIPNGTILIGSDCHYHPWQPRSTAHSAWLRLAHELKPLAIVANGDVMDFPTISKYSWINWEKLPSVAEEIEVAQARLREFEELKAQLYWAGGNHDMRFEAKIAEVAPELAGVYGVHLHDHFPEWVPCWMLEINPDQGTGAVRVKHRWKSGEHAIFNNTVKAGCTLVTGHLHAAQVSPFSDYNGTRYGVDTGCIAVPYDKQFIHYTEANSVNWRSAVTVLTFRDSKLLLPEQLHVFNETQRLTMFRGQVVQESE